MRVDDHVTPPRAGHQHRAADGLHRRGPFDQGHAERGLKGVQVEVRAGRDRHVASVDNACLATDEHGEGRDALERRAPSSAAASSVAKRMSGWSAAR